MADEQEEYESADDDLGEVADHADLPEEGWHEGYVSFVGTRPTKAGAKNRSAKIFVDDYGFYASFMIGPRPGKERDSEEKRMTDRNLRSYKFFARACGIEADESGRLRKFNTDELSKSRVYVLVAVDADSDWPVTAKAFRPMSEPPAEGVVEPKPVEEGALTDAGELDDDDIPF